MNALPRMLIDQAFAVAPSAEPTFAVAEPENTSVPSWLTVDSVNETTSASTDSTVARTVNVSPGNTCEVNRPPNFNNPSTPTRSVTTRPVMPIVSIPCANTDG